MQCYNIKLRDFGSTRKHKRTHSEEKEHETLSADGTCPFWSPEMADCTTGSPDSNPYEDDAWALAVSVYCMGFGDPPFYEPNPLQLFEKITKTQVDILVSLTTLTAHTHETAIYTYTSDNHYSPQIVAPSRLVGNIAEEDKHAA